MGKDKQKYVVVRGCENDKTMKRWEVGEIVKDGDFSRATIANWLKTGVLAKIVSMPEKVLGKAKQEESD